MNEKRKQCTSDWPPGWMDTEELKTIHRRIHRKVWGDSMHTKGKLWTKLMIVPHSGQVWLLLDYTQSECVVGNTMPGGNDIFPAEVELGNSRLGHNLNGGRAFSHPPIGQFMTETGIEGSLGNDPKRWVFRMVVAYMQHRLYGSGPTWAVVIFAHYLQWVRKL